MKKPTTPAKKIAGKKRWYFRHKKVKLKTVIAHVSFYTHPWYFAGKPQHRPILITRKNVSDLAVISREEFAEDTGLYIRLSVVDLFIIYKWLHLGKKLSGFDRFDGIKMFVLDCPIVKSRDKNKIPHYHYICLEQNPEHPEHWRLCVRSRGYIQTREKTPYQILCLQRR